MSSIEPGPLLFAVVVIALTLVPAIVTVTGAWLLARKLGPKWPARLRSPRSIVVLSLLPAAVDVLCAVLLMVGAPASRRGDAVPLAVIVAGVLGGGWALFLLFLTRQFGGAAEPSRLGLRIWLVICLIAAAWVVVLGFGLGVSQGIH